MRTLLIASLLLVGCGSAEDTLNALNRPQQSIVDLSNDVMYGVEEEPSAEVPQKEEYEADYTECDTIDPSTCQ